MLSFVLASRPHLNDGLEALVKDQFQLWANARTAGGVVLGPSALAGLTHPDINTSFGGLKQDTQLFITALSFARVMGFRSMPVNEFDDFCTVGLTQVPIAQLPVPPQVALTIGTRFHDEWWNLRKSWGLTGHEGDKAWPDLTGVQQKNDLDLVPLWAKLMGDYSVSTDVRCKAVIDFIRKV